MKRIIFFLAIVLLPFMLSAQDLGNEMFHLTQIKKDVKSILASEIHMWRHSWRLEKNSDPKLWGNEKNPAR